MSAAGVAVGADGKVQVELAGLLTGQLCISVPAAWPAGTAGVLVFSSDAEDLEDAVLALNAVVDEEGATTPLPQLLDLLAVGAKNGFDSIMPEGSVGSGGSDSEEYVMEEEDEGERGGAELETRRGARNAHALHRAWV